MNLDKDPQALRLQRLRAHAEKLHLRTAELIAQADKRVMLAIATIERARWTRIVSRIMRSRSATDAVIEDVRRKLLAGEARDS